MADDLLRHHGVLVVPGSDFHLESGDHIRLSTLADPTEIKEAMTRIATYFDMVSASTGSQK